MFPWIFLFSHIIGVLHLKSAYIFISFLPKYPHSTWTTFLQIRYLWSGHSSGARVLHLFPNIHLSRDKIKQLWVVNKTIVWWRIHDDWPDNKHMSFNNIWYDSIWKMKSDHTFDPVFSEDTNQNICRGGDLICHWLFAQPKNINV